MLSLLGLAVVALGFALRLNPLPVIAAAALVSGMAAGHDPFSVVSAFGKAFNESRFVSLAWLVLPVVGLLERYGLQDWARSLAGRLRTATTGRVLLAYMLFRQISAALGLTSIGGQVQMVRPLIAPMAEAAAERTGSLPETEREQIRAHAAAADTIGLFFGEDIFIALGSILLIQGVLAHAGVPVSPLRLSVWAIPTAFAALIIHGARLMLLDRRIRRAAAGERAP